MKTRSKRYSTITILAVATLMTITLISGSARAARQGYVADSLFAQPPQVGSVFDAYGNVVRNGDQRFNYLEEPQGGFTAVELDTQNQIISYQSLTESPFGANAATPTAMAIGPSVLQRVGSDPALLNLEWKYGLYGSGIGLSRISVFDIDNDNLPEMIMGASSGGGFGSNDFWYVVKMTSGDTYQQVWSSDSYSASISRIAVADVNTDEIGEIYVGLTDGRVYIYDGLSMGQIGSFAIVAPINDLIIANADSDSDQEIVISDGSKIYVYSAVSLALEWASAAYGGADLAIGNVDADAAPEIIATADGGHGYVLDGVSHVLEWDYISGFGNRVELGDIDSDAKAEIIGAARWYKITVFDADIKSPKWEIPTSLDIGALLVANTDGAGAPEILFGDAQWGAIHCYDGGTQTERWSVNNPEHGVTDIAIGDVNHDGVLEILWGAGHTSTGPDHLYVADTLTHLIEWQTDDITGPLSAVDVGDVDDDGQSEIVMVSNMSDSGYDDGVIHIFNATTHALEWRSTDLPNISAWTGVQSVKIGDVDNDGQTEFIIATADLYDGLIQVYDGQTHTLERQSPKYGGASFTALAIGDVDNDSKTEIVVGQKREHTGATGVYLLVFDGATATEEWKSVGLETYWGQVYDIELADVDADNHVEIAASVSGQRLYVYDGVTHQLDWLTASPVYALAVANVDTDVQKEILTGKDNGVVEEYDGVTFALENSFHLGSGLITGLLIDDVDQDGNSEWIMSESDTLSIFTGATHELVWQSGDMGSALGNYNHLNSLNSDNDPDNELILGSTYALYQFNITRAGPLASSTHNVTPTIILPGKPLTYTIELRNQDVSDVTNILVTDTLPVNLTYNDNSLLSTSGTYGYNSGIITWTGTLNAGGVATITFGATVSPAAFLSSTITNSAVISGGGQIIARKALANIPPAKVYLPLINRNSCAAYSDDFSDPDSGWPSGDDGQFRWEYLSGEYRMLVRPIESWAGTRPGIKCSEYTVAADVRNPTGVNGTSGLIFGLSDDWQQFYTFEIRSDGYYYLWRYDNGDWIIVLTGYSPDINPGSNTNRVKVERTGTQIKAYVNTHLVINTSDGTYTGLRHVGLIATSYDQPNADARFDNFIMCAPGCSAAANLSDAKTIPQNNVALMPPSSAEAESNGANGSKTADPFKLLPQPDTESTRQ